MRNTRTPHTLGGACTKLLSFVLSVSMVTSTFPTVALCDSETYELTPTTDPLALEIGEYDLANSIIIEVGGIENEPDGVAVDSDIDTDSEDTADESTPAEPTAQPNVLSEETADEQASNDELAPAEEVEGALDQPDSAAEENSEQPEKSSASNEPTDEPIEADGPGTDEPSNQPVSTDEPSPELGSPAESETPEAANSELERKLRP